MTLAMTHHLGRLSWGPNIANDAGSPWGRFGGGWQWKLGVDLGHRRNDGSVSGILNLGTRQHRFTWAGKR